MNIMRFLEWGEGGYHGETLLAPSLGTALLRNKGTLGFCVLSQVSPGGLTLKTNDDDTLDFVSSLCMYVHVSVQFIDAQQLREQMLIVLKAINSSIPEANYTSAIQDILDFESAIANVSTKCYNEVHDSRFTLFCFQFTDLYWLTEGPIHEKLREKFKEQFYELDNDATLADLDALMPSVSLKYFLLSQQIF